MSELHHECGVVAIYHLPNREPSPLCSSGTPDEVARLAARMLLDVQNRGQLSAGMTSYNPDRNQLLTTFKDLGTVTEVFRLNHRGKSKSIMRNLTGPAAIGHVRYSTCGQDNLAYAQPFERNHLKRHKWFSFGFNGQLANYAELRADLMRDEDNHLSRDTDTEILMHEISRELSEDPPPSLAEMCRNMCQRFDGAYSLVMLNALGDMLVVRDPLGIKPLCYAFDGSLFAAASESVALLNLGYSPEQIRSLPPGYAVTITDGKMRVEDFANSTHHSHCFFEWIYFANVASTMDGRSVYLSRKALGEELARLETIPIDENTIVVPVPDTSKAAADAMAYKLQVPCLEGLIRNRYMGRTFIEGGKGRRKKAEAKYTPLREVLEGKRVLLVEDSVVRSTTLKALLGRLRDLGRAKEVHVRVASPPIVAPCFYGIDMSTVNELFAPRFLPEGKLTEQAQSEMAQVLGADSLRYLPIESIARSIGLGTDELCRACITGEYPTEAGQKLYEIALNNSQRNGKRRTYESVPTPAR